MTTPHIITDFGLEREWANATNSSRFIKQLSSNALPSKNFDAWLVQVNPLSLVRIDRQDYLFVRAFTTFTARVRDIITSTSPRIASLVQNSYNSLLTERTVFQENASKRGVSIPATSEPNSDPDIEKSETTAILEELKPHLRPACHQYVGWMMSCVTGNTQNKIIDPANIILLLWAMERCYYEAFLSVRQSEKFNELEDSIKAFVEWWTTEEFRSSIDSLEAVFEAWSGGKRTWLEGEAEHVLYAMLHYEEQFWATAFL